MSGFKIGDEVVIVNRDRGGKVQGGQESRDGGMFYFVRFDDGQVLIYREHELGLKSDFAKDKQLATLRCVRELLLSDEFMTAFAKKFFSTPVDGGIVAYDSAESVQSVKIDNVFGEVVVGLPETKISTTFNWHGSRQENEVSE